ncbi:Hypothetical_protein [Hexamita inflata]|uniref:Hypothetical_protein n=1 Tax=Hexamita inflata TaxID=28002 RepID=A0AA86THW2_9EUKA|nr:Hypothetical protein HINF_LOCUS5356 [Hexamita inflata]
MRPLSQLKSQHPSSLSMTASGPIKRSTTNSGIASPSMKRCNTTSLQPMSLNSGRGDANERERPLRSNLTVGNVECVDINSYFDGSQNDEDEDQNLDRFVNDNNMDRIQVAELIKNLQMNNRELKTANLRADQYENLLNKYLTNMKKLMHQMKECIAE